MIPKRNHGKNDKFSVVSNYEWTFFLYMQDDQSPLWISNCFDKNLFLRAVFLVLILQNDDDEMVNKLAKRYKSLSFLPKFKNDVLNSLKSDQMALNAASNTSQKPDDDKQGGSQFKPGSHNKDVDNNKTKTNPKKNDKKKSDRNNKAKDVKKANVLSINSEEIYKIWSREGIFVGEGRTAEVFKIPYEGKWIALKMIDLFKHAENALEELEHEKNFLEKILVEYPKG